MRYGGHVRSAVLSLGIRGSMKKILILEYVAIGILYIVLDQILKYIARSNPDRSAYIWKTSLGWEYFENSGIAFSIPFPNNLLIILTPFAIVGLSIILTKYWCQWDLRTCFRKNIPIRYLFGLVLVIAGASSNLIDRVFFGFTIDYLRILTSVINVADIMIISGVLILLLPKKERGKLRFGKAYVKSQSP